MYRQNVIDIGRLSITKGKTMRYYLYIILTTCLLAFGASAGTAIFQPPTGDSYISSASPNVNYGGMEYLWIGRYGGAHYYSLVYFDAIDNYIGTPINSAYLSLYFAVTYPASDITLKIAKISETWDEYDVTWNTIPGTVAPVYEAEYPLSAGAEWIDLDVTEAVADWLDETAANYGLMLYTEDVTEHMGYCPSKEYTDNTYRPILTVDFNSAIESASLGNIKAAFK